MKTYEGVRQEWKAHTAHEGQGQSFIYTAPCPVPNSRNTTANRVRALHCAYAIEQEEEFGAKAKAPLRVNPATLPVGVTVGLGSSPEEGGWLKLLLPGNGISTTRDDKQAYRFVHCMPPPPPINASSLCHWYQTCTSTAEHCRLYHAPEQRSTALDVFLCGTASSRTLQGNLLSLTTNCVLPERPASPECSRGLADRRI